MSRLSALQCALAFGSLVACSDTTRPHEDPEDVAIRGSEAGNPPVADSDVCVDTQRCRANAERFLEALSDPWTPAPLQAACVDRSAGLECECVPEVPQSAAPGSISFVWPGTIGRHHVPSPELGCLVWSRRATAIPSLREDTAECLYPLPDAAPCELTECSATCRAVERARDADLSTSFNARVRSIDCGLEGCALVFELEGECYVKRGERAVTSAGPFDCSLSDRALLERAMTTR